MYQEDINTAIVEEQKDRDESQALPEDVTEEPRNEEEMHLKYIKKSPALVNVYLPVSDDQGELLGEMELESQVKAFCDQYGDTSNIDKPLEVIEEAKRLVTTYTLKINVVENSLGGKITKYRIREGMLFIILKKLVRQNKVNWIKWFKSNFDAREFRSVQDYMKLARINNIIRYAVFGKERLMHLVRQLSDDQKKADDPIGAFLEQNGIDFNPEQETDVFEIRMEADLAVNRQKLRSAGLEDVTCDVIENLVKNGIHLTNGHLRNLKLLKESGVDPTELLNKLVDNNGKVEQVQTSESKAASFKKTVDRFLSQAELALTDDQYLGKVDVETIKRITEKIRQLEQKFAAVTN